MADPRYALWFAELKNPTPEDRRHDRPTDPKLMSGFWRKHAARTRPDEPVAIWTEPDPEKNPNGVTIFQIGPYVMNTEKHAERWQSFLDKDWLKCTAVLQSPDPKRPELDSWSAAMDEKGPGRWLDGKPSREVTEAERADIIPTTPTEQGGNAMVDENGEELDAEWEQIKANIERDLKALQSLGTITSLDVANKGAEIIERMRANGALGERKRKAEKAPFDEGAAKVQAKYTPTLNPASAAIQAAVAAIDKWKKAEERRLADEAAAARRAEERRLAEELAERKRAEAAELARQAEQMGMENQGPTEEEIEAEAATEAAQQVAEQMPQADTKVRVGTAHGRAVSRSKIKKGRIVDMDAFFQATKEHEAVVEFFQLRANALARAGANVPGVEFYEE